MFPRRWLLLAVAVFCLRCALCIEISNSSDTNCDGLTITVLAEERLGDEMQFSGIVGPNSCITIHKVPSYYGLWKESLAMETRQSTFYDMYILPEEYTENLVVGSYLVNLYYNLRKDSLIRWGDIFLSDREAVSKDYSMKEIFGVPLSGSYLYFISNRRTLSNFGLKSLPKSWQELLSLTASETFHCFNPQSVDEDLTEPTLHPIFLSILASVIQTKGSKEGFLFDVNTMNPLMEEKAVVYALETFSVLVSYLQLQFISSNNAYPYYDCLFAIGTAADVLHAAIYSHDFVISRVPGSEIVFNKETATLMNCSSLLCPNAEMDGDRVINFAPLSFGGLAGVISHSVSGEKLEKVYEFVSSLSSISSWNYDHVASLGIGHRISQAEGDDFWFNHFQLTKEDSGNLSEVMRQNAASANMATGMRILDAPRYFARVLEPKLVNYLANGSATATHSLIQSEWDSITTSLGRTAQQEIYLRSLGFFPGEEIEVTSLSYSLLYMIHLISFSVLFEYIVVFVLVVIFRKANIYFLDGRLFVLLSMVGCVLMILSVTFSLLPPTYYNVVTCMLPVWLLVPGFALAYFSIFIKSYKSYTVFTNLNIERIKGKSWKLLIIEAFVLVIGFLILIGFSIQSPLELSYHIHFSLDKSYADAQCSSPHMHIWGTAIILYFLLILSCVLYMSLQVRKILSVTTESRYIIPAVFISVTAIVFSSISLEIVDSNAMRLSFISLSIIVVSLACFNFQTLPIIFHSLLRQVRKRISDEKRQSNEDDIVQKPDREANIEMSSSLVCQESNLSFTMNVGESVEFASTELLRTDRSSSCNGSDQFPYDVSFGQDTVPDEDQEPKDIYDSHDQTSEDGASSESTGEIEPVSVSRGMQDLSGESQFSDEISSTSGHTSTESTSSGTEDSSS